MKKNRLTGFCVAAMIVVVMGLVVFFAGRADSLGTDLPETSSLSEATNETVCTEKITRKVTETTTTAEQTTAGTVLIRELYDGGELFAETYYPDTIDKHTIDDIVEQWNDSGYDYMGVYEYVAENGQYTLDLSFQKRASASYGSSYVSGEWTYICEPYQVNSYYEGVHCITDTSSAQWAWLQSHDYYYDSEGIAMYDGRVLVALTPAYGGIGDYVDLLLTDGSVLQTIIVDHKDSSETWGHRTDSGALNVIEILVSPSWYECGHENKWYADVEAFR